MHSVNNRVLLRKNAGVFGLLVVVLLVAGCQQVVEHPGTPQPTETVAIPMPDPETVARIFTAFPGAEGFGSATTGGRFGRVLEVTNLKDSGEGSLRAALEAIGPRIVVFRTGGTIILNEPIIVSHPFVTLAGQTAPGDGITLAGEGLIIATHDVIVRGLRIRIGDRGIPSGNRDGINISTTFAESDVYNIVIDHCSVSWAIDENISTWVASNKPYTLYNITIQWTISSEGLFDSIHVDEGVTNGVTDPHSMGLIVGKNGYRVSIHHNLLAHNEDRNPLVSGITDVEIVNNVVYGWRSGPAKFSQDKNIAHVFKNYFKPADYSRNDDFILPNQNNPQSAYYLLGNVTDLKRSKDLIPSRILNRGNILLASSPLFSPSNMSVFEPNIAYELVLENVGAIAPQRDAIDARIVEQVRERTGEIIDSQDQVGGWVDMDAGVYPQDSDHDGMPDEWEVEQGLDPSDSTDGNQVSPSGYTWIEEYINGLIPTNG